MIYFLRDSGGAIKIGISVRLSCRLVDLARERKGPVELLGVMPGGRSEEASLHRTFAKHRMEGEWYHPATSLLWYIKTNAVKWDGKDEKRSDSTLLKVGLQLPTRLWRKLHVEAAEKMTTKSILLEQMLRERYSRGTMEANR